VARRVLARIARAVAGVGRARIAVVGARRPARLLRIGGTRGIRPVAGLGHVAVARGGPALGADVARRVPGAGAAGIAGVVGAGVVVVAVGRGARDAGVVHARLEPVADVPVVAVPVAHAAVGDRSVDAADGGITEVVGADEVVVAVELRAVLAAGGGGAGRDP